MTYKLEKSDWRKLIRDFENHRVVLLLGRSTAKAQYKGKLLPLNEIFASHLAQLLQEDGVGFEESHANNLSYIAQKFLAQDQNRRTDLEDEICIAYEDNTKEIPQIYKQLAELPFQLIINTTPDDFMVRALRETGKFPNFHWYDFRKNHNPRIENISVDTPLVYNIYGSFKDPESMMITERDRVDFFKNIIKDEPSVPPKIISLLDERTTYLFFDFNLEEWPFRLLFDGLNLQENSRSVTPRHPIIELSHLTKDFYSGEFNFRFIDHHAEEFSAELHRLFVEKEAQGQPVVPSKKKNVFISYADKDKTHMKELLKYLRLLEQKSWIRVWYRELIEAGEDEAASIELELQQADIVLLLVSADFIADDQIFKREVKPSLVRNRKNEATVVPVLIRSCSWEMAEYSNLPTLPDTKMPVNSTAWSNPELAYTNIVKGIEKLLF